MMDPPASRDTSGSVTQSQVEIYGPVRDTAFIQVPGRVQDMEML